MLAVLLGITVLAVAWWILRRLLLFALAGAAIIALLAFAHHQLPIQTCRGRRAPSCEH